MSCGRFVLGLLTALLLASVSQIGQAQDQEERELSFLNVSIATFDPGVPTDVSSHRRLQVFPRIREVEALFLPFVLREALVASDQWGAVRVIPETDIAAEVLVSGTVTRSDGEVMELQIRVVDASGRVWINKAYMGSAKAGEATDSGDTGTAGYQALYEQIVQDMINARAQLTEKELKAVVELSLLRYADRLAPAAFGEYLTRGADGIFTLQRLPAENDPMLERIERIRRAEYIVTDTLDEKFQELHTEIAATYDLWRDYRRQLARYQYEKTKQLQNRTRKSSRDSFQSIKERYDNYKWARIQAQEEESWAEGFNNEVEPTIKELESRVAELEGLVETQYAEWGRLLADIFSMENERQ